MAEARRGLLGVANYRADFPAGLDELTAQVSSDESRSAGDDDRKVS